MKFIFNAMSLLTSDCGAASFNRLLATSMVTLIHGQMTAKMEPSAETTS